MECATENCTHEGVAQIATNMKSLHCLCCFRARRMIYGARKYNKYYPDFEILRQMLHDNRLCPVCGKIMLWKAGKLKADVATLQHYKDGSIGIMCHSCNTSDGLIGAPYRGAIKNLVKGGDALCPAN